jgi:D-alanyl-lipoteichoic acid acyltransferase DltB (MBOAT superfamily)
MTWAVQLLLAAGYLALGRWLVGSRARWRELAFALLNVAAVYVFFFLHKDWRFSLIYVVYLALVVGQYWALRWWSERRDWLPWLAFLAPLAGLILIRYVPPELPGRFSNALREVMLRNPNFSFGGYFIGISYLAFRTSHLVLEVRNGTVPRPNFWQYLGFAFFAPTLSVGPINAYSNHRRGFDGTARAELPVGRALLRLLVGAVKYRFLGAVLNQLAYASLLLDGHPHHWIDLPIAGVAYYLYLYCNFSGFCDVAVGAAGLMGIPVTENFDNPFAARNVKDFWNRWHITLSQYMRDVVFSPLSKLLVRIFPAALANHAIALTIVVVFLLVGVWHGAGWNYAAFGAAHALGVVSNHYYTIALKKWLGKDRFAAYNRNRTIQAVAVTGTFLYVAASLFLFANNWNQMKTIFTMLAWR